MMDTSRTVEVASDTPGVRSWISNTLGRVPHDEPVPEGRPDGTLLLLGGFDQCQWVAFKPGTLLIAKLERHCDHPVTYVFLCSYSGLQTVACDLHTALLRANHPNWIAEVRKLPPLLSDA